MPKIKQYIVDAFTDKIFLGNPATVCVTERQLEDDLMQRIAIENNFSETAFIVKGAGPYLLRWFTPGGEIDLCGHATLASAFVLDNFYNAEFPIAFSTMSGQLTIKELQRTKKRNKGLKNDRHKKHDMIQ